MMVEHVTVKRGEGRPDLIVPLTDLAQRPGFDTSLAAAIDDADSGVHASLSATYVARVTGLTVDGTGNNSTILQAAIDAASTAGGGELILPRGTIRANVTLKPKVVLVGEGVGNTILKSVAASNAPAVKGLNFDTLTGKAYAVGDINLGCYQAGLRNLTVDGDKSSQTSGWVVQLWGRSLVLDRVQVQNGKSGGLWTEFTTHDAGAVDDLLEGFMSSIKTASNDGDGWRFRGPHDSVIENYVTVSNTGWGFKSEAAANSYKGSVSGSAWNSWLNTTGSYYFGDTFRIVDGIASGGSTGTGIDMAAGIGNCFYQGLISGHVTGMVVRGSQHTINVQAKDITGTLFQLGETGVATCGYCLINFTGLTITKAFDRQNVASPNVIVGRFSGTTLESGSSGSASDYWNVIQVGGAGTIKHELPGSQFTAVGWSPKYPQSNGVLLTKDASGTTVGAAGAAAVLPALPVAYWTVKDESGNSFKIPVYNV